MRYNFDFKFLEQVKGGNLSMFGIMNNSQNNDTNSQKQNYERLRWLHSILIEQNIKGRQNLNLFHFHWKGRFLLSFLICRMPG